MDNIVDCTAMVNVQKLACGQQTSTDDSVAWSDGRSDDCNEESDSSLDGGTSIGM
jgi:hypothetical protein